MNEYEQIMSIEAVWPFVVAYSVMGALASIQVAVGLIGIFSGLCGMLKIQPPQLLKYFGAMVVDSERSRWLFSGMMLVVGSCMIAPLLISLPFTVGVFAFIGLCCLTLCYSSFPELGKGEKGFLSRVLIMLFSTVTLGLTVYDQQTPATSMQNILADIRNYRPKEQEWQNRLDVKAPKVGDTAPNFSLLTASGDAEVKLSDFIGDRPTVLFLGANTCPVFSAGMKDINRLYEKYSGKVNFVGVYVSEPHAINEWPLTRTHSLQTWEAWVDHPVAVDLKQATDYSQRQFAAQRMAKKLLNQSIPLLVDDMDNVVNNTWVGRPARLYLISKDGRVIYNPGKGPYSFNPTYLEPMLEGIVGNPSI